MSFASATTLFDRSLRGAAWKLLCPARIAVDDAPTLPRRWMIDTGNDGQRSVETNSVRSSERVLGVARSTVERRAVLVGKSDA